MIEIHWGLSSRSHSCYFLGDTKHGDICEVSSLTYPEMSQLCSTFGEGSFQPNTTSCPKPILSPGAPSPCAGQNHTWERLPGGALEQLLCLEAGDKEALLRHPLRARKGCVRAGGRQDSLQTPGWLPGTAAFPQTKRVTSPDWRVGDILSPTSFGWLQFPLTGIKIKSRGGVLPKFPRWWSDRSCPSPPLAVIAAFPSCSPSPGPAQLQRANTSEGIRSKQAGAVAG